MAGNLLNSLYPPQTPTFMPAFVSDEEACVTFSLSPYNSKETIERIHISVVDQKTNQNCLATTQKNKFLIEADPNYKHEYFCTNGILVTDFKISEDGFIQVTEDGLYQIKIPIKILNSELIPNQYYKVQVRFDCNIESIGNQANYLADYSPYFSEWSSVSLIRKIPKPDILLYNFDLSNKKQEPSFSVGAIPFHGTMVYEKTDSAEETLESYVFTIRAFETNEIVYVSDKKYTADQINPNSISCMADLHSQKIGKYEVSITATTKNQYVFSKKWYFNLIVEEESGLNGDPAVWSVKENSEDGCVEIKLSASFLDYSGRIFIKRASSKDDYKKWEILHCATQLNSSTIDISFQDFTVCSLIGYKYCFQFQNSQNTLYAPVAWDHIIYPKFYDIFLYGNNKQYAIRYNPQINSVKPVVNRVKIDTLGGRYPKFVENANLKYNQYSISGLITAEADFNRKFLREYDYRFWQDLKEYNSHCKNIYMIRNDALPIDESFYDNIGNSDEMESFGANSTHSVYLHENWYWERAFRTELIEWLNNGEVKLCRSMSEGNQAVVLTDINLTPQINTGRLLYNFSATMYEVGDGYSLDFLNELNIIKLPAEEEMSMGITSSEESASKGLDKNAVGQLINYIAKKESVNLVEKIGDAFNQTLLGKNTKSKEDISSHATNYSLTHVKIQFISPPKYYSVYNNNVKEIDPMSADESTMKNSDLGYILYVKTGTSSMETPSIIFVKADGYYEFFEDTSITYLSVDQNAVFNLDYVFSYKENFNYSSVVKTETVEKTVVGQIVGPFNVEQKLNKQVENRYASQTYNKNLEITSSQTIDFWSGVSFDVSPYSVVNIQYKNQENFEKFIINSSGIFDSFDAAAIEEISFLGKYMYKRQENAEFLEDWEFVLSFSEESNENDNYEFNHVYKIGDEYKLYAKNGVFYNFEFLDSGQTEGIAKMPVDGVVNYTGQIVKKVFGA